MRVGELRSPPRASGSSATTPKARHWSSWCGSRSTLDRPAGDGRRRRPPRAGDRRGAGRCGRLERSPSSAARPTRADKLVELIQQHTAACGDARVDLTVAPIAVEPEIAVLVNATSLGTANAGREAAARSRLVRAEDGRRRRGLQHVAHLAHAAGGRARLPHHRRPVSSTSSKRRSPFARGPA